MESESKFVYVLALQGKVIGVFDDPYKAFDYGDVLIQSDTKTANGYETKWNFTVSKCAINLSYVEELAHY